MNLTTHKLQIRLTEEKLTYIMEHSANYGSMSHYIHSAVKGYYDPSGVRQLQIIEALGRFYHYHHDDLSQVINELLKIQELPISIKMPRAILLKL